MRKILLLLVLFMFSCGSDDLLDKIDEGIDCGILNPISLSVLPTDNSAELVFGSFGHFDGPFLSCPPQAYNLYMSEDGSQYERLTQFVGESGQWTVNGLENGETYFFRMTALHNHTDSVMSEVVMTTIGTIALPQFIDNPLSVNFERFQLAPDEDRFLYRTSSDDWFLTSFSNPSERRKVIDDSFSAQWDPHNVDKVAYREKEYVQISTSTNGITTKALRQVDVNDLSEDDLHDIPTPMDFGDVLKPEQYWIHGFAYALDGDRIYFESNKDNGSATLRDKKVFDNIWQLDIPSKSIKPLSDFLALNFEMKSFVEDPKAPNNFYVLGGFSGEVVESSGLFSNRDRIDVYYYNTSTQSLSLVLETIYEEKLLDINPSGDKLLITNTASGREEIWTYDITTKQLRQITQSQTYRYTKYTYYPNWTSDNTFMVSLYHNDVLKFGVFSI